MSVNYNSFPKYVISFPVNSNSSYTIISYYGNTTTTSRNVISGNISTGIYTTPDLSFNTLYTFTVTSYNSSGYSGIPKVFTVNTTPSVTWAYATSSTSSNTQLQWYGTYNYVKIYRKITAPYTTDYVDVSAGTKITTLPYYDNDLSGNTSYKYFIRPYDINDISYPESNEIIFTTNALAAKDLSAIYYDNSGITVNFTLPKNSYISTYNYQLKAVYGGNVITSNGTTTAPIILSGLSSSTNYSCYILSYLDGVLSGTSNPLNVKTKVTLPYFYNIPTFDSTTSSNKFISATMSYTGQYIYVANSTTTGYKSTDFGNTWTTITFPNLTKNICCSWDASMVYAAGNNGGGPSAYLFKSTNYGATFITIKTGIPSEAGDSTVCCSYDGKYVYWGGSGGDQFKYSYDFGVTVTSATSSNGRQVVNCSYDGKYLITANNSTGTSSYYLDNSLYNYSGGNWSKTFSFNSNFGSCAISSGGTYMLAIHNNIWNISSNNGTTWAALPSPVNGAFATKGCSMSYTGQYMMVGYNGYLYYSKNYGVSWTIVDNSSYGGNAVYGTGNINTQCLSMAQSGAYAIVNSGSNTSYYLIQLF